jgi:hypothetical protein
MKMDAGEGGRRIIAENTKCDDQAVWHDYSPAAS